MSISFLNRLYSMSSQRFEGKKEEKPVEKKSKILSLLKKGYDFSMNQDLVVGDEVRSGKMSGKVSKINRVQDTYTSEEEFNHYLETYGTTGLSWDRNEIMTVDVVTSPVKDENDVEAVEEFFVYEVEKVGDVESSKQAAGPTQPKPTTDPGPGKKYIWNEEAQAWEIVDEGEETVEIKKEMYLDLDKAVESSWLVRKGVDDVFYKRRPKEVELPDVVPPATNAVKDAYDQLLTAYNKMKSIDEQVRKLEVKFEEDKKKLLEKNRQNDLQLQYDSMKDELKGLLSQAGEHAYKIAGDIVALYQKVKSGQYKPTDKDKLAAVLAKFPEAQKVIDDAMVQLVQEKSKPDVPEEKPVIFPDVTQTSLKVTASALDSLKSLVDGLKKFIGIMGEVGQGLEELGEVEPALASKKLAFAMGDTVVYKAGTPEEEEGLVTGYVGKTVNVKFNLSGETINVSPELLTLKGKESKKKAGLDIYCPSCNAVFKIEERKRPFDIDCIKCGVGIGVEE